MRATTADLARQLATLARRVNATLDHSGPPPLERSGYVVLGLLHDLGPQRMGALALAAGLDPSTISRQVQAVIVQGFAHRAYDRDDGRARRVALTELGTSMVHRARRAHHDLVEEAFADWSDADCSELLALVSRLNRDMGGPSEDAAVEAGAADGTDGAPPSRG